MKRALLKRVSIYTVSVAAGLTLVGGLLHTKAARPLLAHMGVGCPVKASPEDVEVARINSARAQRGTETATSRPALGFALDTMTLKDVKAWADQKHVSCEDVRVGLLRCVDVPVAAIGGSGPVINKLDFGFSPGSERLVNISAWRGGLTSTVAVAQMDAVVASMKDQVGDPTTEAGTRDASYLAGGRMHTAIVSYRFKDYIADVSATNIPGRGLTLREHYMSARD
ncbi:MAG: hypothetical protein ABIQ16_05490 [Polyangiaceae bacterium]